MGSRKTALLIVTGLLMPGGFLLLAWLLCRQLLLRVDMQAVQRLVQVLLLSVFVQGCATQFGAREGEAPAATLQFQNLSVEPAGAQVFVGPEALQPGDILLTSMPGFTAMSIELVTFAPVSHAALYIGDGRVVEAVRSGVGERSIDEVMADESVALVLRYPGLSQAQARRMREYARAKTGAGFNFVGVWLQIPYEIGRRACELPLVPGAVRDPCVRGMGLFSHLAPSNGRMFCSQLVLQAYRHAGVELTAADSRIVSPADILHMRQGDVSSFTIRKPLLYVGHLKYDRPLVAALAR